MSKPTVTKVTDKLAIPDEAITNPHHVLKSGTRKGFKNPYPSYTEPGNPLTMLFHVVWGFASRQLSFPDTKTVPLVPVVRPTWLPEGERPSSLRATWLGHACYFVEFPSGLRVLFDPVFEDRCSPFKSIGPRRFTAPPCDLAELPTVDAVVISHSHYDHLSHDSVLRIQERNPGAHFFVGLGLESWFRRSGLNNVTELDWWQDADLAVDLAQTRQKPWTATSTTATATATTMSTPATATATTTPTTIMEQLVKARISCLPAQHNSARGPFDKDTTLWCSWAVRSGGKSVWFGGDTGYRTVPRLPDGTDDYGPAYEALPRCPQFRQIGKLRGPFDLGLIPIGAYGPRSFFSHMHANPHDAVEIFRDTRCRRAMGIHWGTWALTFEDVGEPPVLLREALRRRGLPEEGAFDVCDVGESREF